MDLLKRILLVEDSPRDTELALEAFAANHLLNEVLSLSDGAEMLFAHLKRIMHLDRLRGDLKKGAITYAKDRQLRFPGSDA